MQALARTGLRTALRSFQPACPMAGAVTRPTTFRCFSSELLKRVTSELKQEEMSYKHPEQLQKFLSTKSWKLETKEGDVNLALLKDVGDVKLTVEFQLTSPVAPPPDEGGEEGEEESEVTDFTITVEKANGSGLTFACVTHDGDARFLIGNVRTFDSAEEKDSISGYSGPEFEDLDDSLQDAFDEYLATLGVDSDLCDFIDAAALDKEQQEYIRWLGKVSKFLA